MSTHTEGGKNWRSWTPERLKKFQATMAAKKARGEWPPKSKRPKVFVTSGKTPGPKPKKKASSIPLHAIPERPKKHKKRATKPHFNPDAKNIQALRDIGNKVLADSAKLQLALEVVRLIARILA